VTGHTGFKGSWLTVWLLKLGAKVIGISKDIPTKPSMFEVLRLNNKITHYFEDIRNLTNLKKIFFREEPDFIFHLAAQPIVSESYNDPINTITTNVIGTANILDCLKKATHHCIAIIITSDKCYDNVEWCWGYRENDRLGGKDIYSGSKGAAELIIKSYFHSFLKEKKNITIGITRAGNVIGGGDWAKDRIVPDCVRAWSRKEKVFIRNPYATRPWQHVLEPLSGYLTLAEKLQKNSENINGEAFNFGPASHEVVTVKTLISDLAKYWNISDNNAFEIKSEKKFHEAGLLKLNCDKALHHLKWKPTLNYNKTVKFTAEWYYKFYNINDNMYEFTLDQIDEYERMMKNENCGNL